MVTLDSVFSACISKVVLLVIRKNIRLTMLFCSSHESGIDNPFRPDGELSREADTIVSLIKEGKPITPQDPSLDPQTEEAMEEPQVQQQHQAALKAAPNGVDHTDSGTKGTNGTTPGVVEVQRGVIAPPAPSEAVEQVVIKKKPKCHCCTIQ